MSTTGSAASMDQRDIEWARGQEKLSRTSARLTGVGAAALGSMLAVKHPKVARRLPKKVSRAITGQRADDVRNALAVIGMGTGAVSGTHYANKLREDLQTADPQERARRVAKAMSEELIVKGVVRSGVARTAKGLRIRRASFRRTPMPRPRRYF